MNINEISFKIKKLPPRIISEVLDYVEFLLKKYGSEDSDIIEDTDKFKFDWEGGLSNLKDQYSSVELQHKAMDWR